MVRSYMLHHKDIFWVSKDMVDTDTTIVLGEYYCLNKHHKFEMYENQIISNNKLFILMNCTFRQNLNRKWYQFWKPVKIINGYRFQCIDLGEK